MAAWVAENRPDIEVVIPAQPNTPAAAWAAIEQAIADLKARHGSAPATGRRGQLPRWLYGNASERAIRLPRRPHQPGGAPHELLCDYLGPRPTPTVANAMNCCPDTWTS